MPISIKEKFLKSTAVVSIFTMLSRIFGYIRDALMFIFISNASGALDAFFVAFRIPNFFRRIFGEGALSTAYIPVLSDYKNKDDQKEVKEFINTSITTISLILLIVSVIGVLIAPILIYLIAPGFVNSEFGQYDLTVSLLKITFPYMLFICLTAIAGSILNTYDNFAYPAITPVVLNLSLIASVLFAAPYFEKPVFALASFAEPTTVSVLILNTSFSPKKTANFSWLGTSQLILVLLNSFKLSASRQIYSG